MTKQRLSLTKNEGAPWLRRSLVSGRPRQISRIVPSTRSRSFGVHDHVPILPYDRGVDEPARYLVYSITNTYLGVLCLRLGLDLDAPDRGLDRRCPPAGRFAAAAAEPHERHPGLRAAAGLPRGRPRPAVGAMGRRGAARSRARTGPGLPARVTVGPTRTRATCSSGRSSTSPPRAASQARSSGAAAAARARRHLARAGARRSQRARSRLGDADDVRGRYHPCWVGHRTLASTVADQTRFWTALAAGELRDLDVLTESVEIGFDAPGFHRRATGWA